MVVDDNFDNAKAAGLHLIWAEEAEAEGDEVDDAAGSKPNPEGDHTRAGNAA
ncbi:hypothetical protein [uncultured Friedmanniella sp.]|uniref:hypothetical protein n=1 Tax=uncultured Friedmanniella sp. TaxID=335381 RepID=UPI0035C98B19